MKRLIVALTLLLGILIVTPTEAQSRFWVLVNGTLRYSGNVFLSNGSYGFTGVSNSFGLSGTGSVVRSADGGAYLIVTNGQVFVNSATLTMGTGGTPDVTITRAAANEITFSSLTFSNLGTPANGSFAFCSDCTETTPASCPVTQASCVCTNGGNGAFARRVNGAWYCTF